MTSKLWETRMLTKRMMGLALAATLGLCAPAGAADRAAVAEQVAAKCRKAYPILGIEPNEYAVQTWTAKSLC
jgi:hypothetical protein